MGRPRVITRSASKVKGISRLRSRTPESSPAVLTDVTTTLPKPPRGRNHPLSRGKVKRSRTIRSRSGERFQPSVQQSEEHRRLRRRAPGRVRRRRGRRGRRGPGSTPAAMGTESPRTSRRLLAMRARSIVEVAAEIGHDADALEIGALVVVVGVEQDRVQSRR